MEREGKKKKFRKITELRRQAQFGYEGDQVVNETGFFELQRKETHSGNLSRKDEFILRMHEYVLELKDKNIAELML